MSKMKKIGVCMAAMAGIAGIAGISARAVEGVRKKWFIRGYESGQLMGSLSAAESFAHEKTVIQKKYDKLCDEYNELAEQYKELLEYYAVDNA